MKAHSISKGEVYHECRYPDRDLGLFCTGTLEDVKQQFVDQWKAFPAEYCMIVCHYAQQPKKSVIENLEKFMKHIKPELDKITAEAWGNRP